MNNKNNIIVEINNLTKFFHNKNKSIVAIENLSFNIENEQFISIIGPSGCGKSTILSILANLEKPTSGSINFKKNVVFGYMLQKDMLFPWLTVLDNCLIGLKIQKKINKKNKSNVLRLLNEYGLSDFIYSYPNSLSGGMKQRVALIRTLAINPDILLLDEPLSALDSQTRLEICDDLFKILKKEKKSVIMVTHDIAEAVSFSDKVIVLKKRPASIKNIYKINFKNKSYPSFNRNYPEYKKYYDLIRNDLYEQS